MPMKPKNFIIPLVIYPFDVMVSIGETTEQVKSRLSTFDLPEDSLSFLGDLRDTSKGQCEILPTNQTIIRFPEEPTPDIVAHECFHAATFILDRVGMKFKMQVSDEAYAYLIQYLTAEILKGINKKPRSLRAN